MSVPLKCNSENLDLDLLYTWGDESHIRSVQKKYVKYFQNSSGPVLDVGCGRGILLELLKQADVKAYGIDLSRESIKICRDRGLDAVQGDALGHLSALQDRSLGGMICSHVIEHLEPTHALDFIEQCRRVMKSGAKFIMVTPNAADLRTMERFWLDLTHIRPYPQKLLVVLLERAGFRVIKITEDPEPSRNMLVKIAKLFLKMWFMGFMFKGDLVVIAERRE
ncbi:MAG: class I SAM-dependent methyltransferase [Nitrospirae bacterium]|nr:class I SAM-dependent methyltransferase [Nitrospirota bacterium]